MKRREDVCVRLTISGPQAEEQIQQRANQIRDRLDIPIHRVHNFIQSRADKIREKMALPTATRQSLAIDENNGTFGCAPAPHMTPSGTALTSKGSNGVSTTPIDSTTSSRQPWSRKFVLKVSVKETGLMLTSSSGRDAFQSKRSSGAEPNGGSAFIRPPAPRTSATS